MKSDVIINYNIIRMSGGDFMDVVHNIRQIRSERRLSQEDIAEVLNTTQQQYSKYENGTNEIPVRHVITLCKFYNISADWLLGLTDKLG